MLTYQGTFQLIQELNSLIDKMDRRISSAQSAYISQKENLKMQHDGQLRQFEAQCSQAKETVATQAMHMLDEAVTIQNEIARLDKKLEAADKYYQKTKARRQQELAGIKSGHYAAGGDYFTALKAIKTDYEHLSKKYSEDILPQLLNGINYMFSSQRKKNYEELIVLQNTVNQFVREMNKEIPELAGSTAREMQSGYEKQRQELIASQNAAMEHFDASYNRAMDAIAAEIDQALDQLLPEKMIFDLAASVQEYRNAYGRINRRAGIAGRTFYMGNVLYRAGDFIDSKVLAAFVNEKCRPLLAGQSIAFPIMNFSGAPYSICIKKDEYSTKKAGQLMQGIMFSFLSTVPAGHLRLTVIDCDNHGNSAGAFYELQKKMPELFHNGFCITKEEAAEKIYQLNEKIEYILHNLLGTQYRSVYEYAEKNPEYDYQIELLSIFDLPAGLDERQLSVVGNLLTYGARCGIYTAMTIPKVMDEARMGVSIPAAVNQLARMCMVIDADAGNGHMSLRGLEYVETESLPEQSELNRYFARYMLLYESAGNRSIVFPELLSRILNGAEEPEAEENLIAISKLLEDAGRNCGMLPGEKGLFPEQLVLGRIHYPADIFEGHALYDKICSYFSESGFSDGKFSTAGRKIALPMLFDLRQNANLLMEYTEKDSDGLLRAADAFLWCFLSEIPVNQLNICVFDYEKKGRSISSFMELRNGCPGLFDEAIHTGLEEICGRLQKIDKQIDRAIQDKLAGRFENMIEYNRSTPGRQETLTVLMIYDFPAGFDSRSRELLANIMRNGGKCGIYTILCYNRNTAVSAYENVEEWIGSIQKCCIHLSFNGEKQLLRPYDFPVMVSGAVSAERAEQFAALYAERSNELKNKGLPFQEILDPVLFSRESGREFAIPVGIGDGGKVVPIVFGTGSSHHALIAGATGSGKSTLLHTFIMSAMLHYLPDRLHLYLMDFKSGTEFKIYESVRLPHIKLLALDAMQEFGESILENLVSEMESRSRKFKEYNVSKMSEYIKVSGKPMPAVLVIMDEFQVLYSDSTNRRVAVNCAQLTKRIVTEGRSFGIHLMMATQSTKIITDLTLDAGTIEQMRIRIGLKCGEADARYLFTDRNEENALDMMKGPLGTAVLNEEYTEQDNIGFRTVQCDEAAQKHYLSLLAEKLSDYLYDMQSFEGSRTIDLLSVKTIEDARLCEERTVKIEIGSMIKVAPPHCVTFDSRRRHNTLICGTNQRMTDNLVHLYCLGILQNINTTLYCIDGEVLLADDDMDGCYREFARFEDRFRLAQTRGDIIRLIRQVYDDYVERRKSGGTSQSYILIRNLQFLDLVKAMLKNDEVEENDYLEEADGTGGGEEQEELFAFEDIGGLGVTEKMQKLLEDGTGYGIHFIITSAEYQSVKDTMYYGENILSKFPERFVYALSDTDADFLIDGVMVSKLFDNTVYYTDSVKSTFQVKPYIFPNEEQLHMYVSKLLEES